MRVYLDLVCVVPVDAFFPCVDAIVEEEVYVDQREEETDFDDIGPNVSNLPLRLVNCEQAQRSKYKHIGRFVRKHVGPESVFDNFVLVMVDDVIHDSGNGVADDDVGDDHAAK